MSKLSRLFGIGEGTPPAIPAALAAAQNGASDRAEVRQINVDVVSGNPFQPRKFFDEASLQELAASIAEHGIIQPLLVRPKADGFEVIAGERRLRAARIAGLASVPAIVRDIDDREMAELAMIENLQREDLHYLEEAEGFQYLLGSFGLTQDELARRLGKNQSTIANKLRLLRLAPEVRQALIAAQLTERHARALLKLEDPAKQELIIEAVRQNGFNVRETESFIDRMLDDISREMKKKAPRQKVVGIIRDVRIFINSINQVAEQMKKSGLPVKVEQDQDENFVTIRLRIPKRR